MCHSMSHATDAEELRRGENVRFPAGTAKFLAARFVPVSILLLTVEGLLVLLVLLSHMTGDQQFAAICVMASLFTCAVVVVALLTDGKELLPRRSAAPEQVAAPSPRGERSVGGDPDNQTDNPLEARARRILMPDDPELIEVGGERFDDPFDIPARYAGEIDPSQWARVFDIIRAKYGRLIADAFQDEDARALLLCDRQVIQTARSPDEFDDRQMRQIQGERDRLCFIFGREEFIEECPWSAVAPDDAYPTLRVWLAPESTQPHELRRVGLDVIADFDTGNPRHGPFAIDDGIRQGAALSAGFLGRGSHLGRPYGYTRMPMTVGVEGENQSLGTGTAVVRFVRDWANSPFVVANPRRRAFVGREIMFGLRLRICLDPVARSTLIEPLA